VLSLKQWTPCFDTLKEKIDVLPIWVKFPYIPLEFWQERDFRAIGDRLGRFLDIDKITRQKEVTFVAKISVGTRDEPRGCTTKYCNFEEYST
jgi:hypothetical protein